MNTRAVILKMTALAQPLRQRFDALPANDKRALLIMIVTVLAAVAYLLFSTTHTYQQKSIAFYKDAREDMYWMNINKAEIKKLVTPQAGASSATPSDGSLIAAATGAAKPFNVSFKRFQPEGDTGLRLWIEAAEFDRLLQWIDAMNKQGIVLEQLDVDRLEKQVGLVDARILLKRE